MVRKFTLETEELMHMHCLGTEPMNRLQLPSETILVASEIGHTWLCRSPGRSPGQSHGRRPARYPRGVRLISRSVFIYAWPTADTLVIPGSVMLRIWLSLSLPGYTPRVSTLTLTWLNTVSLKWTLTNYIRLVLLRI